MLTTEKIKQVLDKHGIAYEFNHFSTPVAPPFIVYNVPTTTGLTADNIVYHSFDDIEIELYSRVDTLSEEKKLEQLFNDNGLVWNKQSQTWIDNEKLMMSVYSVV